MSDNTPQQIINLGSAPNSGTGEDLRAAFAAVNNNFANVWAAGPVDTQVTITNNWVSTTETDLDLVIAGNGLGNIQMQTTALTQDIRPLSTGVYDLGSANLQYNSGWIRYQNVETLVAAGNIEANYFIGNGSQLTGIAGGNADLGNWAFTGNQIYNINGGSIDNGDLSHGATSGLTIPLNSGNLSDLNLTNIYGNIVVLTGNGPSADQYWQFDRAGNLVFPGGAILGNTYGDDGNNIALQPGANGYALLNSVDQRQYIQVDNNAIYVGTDYPAHNYTWTFGNTGVLTLPGEGVLRSVGDSVTLQSYNVGTGNVQSVYLGSGGGLGFFDQDIGGNWLEIFRSGAEPQIRVPVGRGNLNFQTAEGINAYDWVFDNTGILTAPGPITTSGTVITTPVALASLTAVAGARAFINDGNLVAAGNFGQQVGGSGSNTVPVWSDGTNWYIG